MGISPGAADPDLSQWPVPLPCRDGGQDATGQSRLPDEAVNAAAVGMFPSPDWAANRFLSPLGGPVGKV